MQIPLVARAESIRDADIGDAWTKYRKLLIEDIKGEEIDDRELRQWIVAVGVLDRWDTISNDWMALRGFRREWMNARQYPADDPQRFPHNDAMCRIRDDNGELFAGLDLADLLEQ